MSPIETVFEALRREGCEPHWIDGGRAIVATCPCCREPGALVVQRTEDAEGLAQ